MPKIQASAPHLRELSVKLSRLNFAFAPGLENKSAIPTSQLVDVYGLTQMITIVQSAHDALKGQIERQKYAHLPDVQGYLQQETLAAYRFLAEPECAGLWGQFIPQIAEAVRTRKLDTLQTMHRDYRAEVERITHSDRETRRQRPWNPPQQYGVTAALAWCILVDSALLTERLQRDMKETASAKGQMLAGCDPGCAYYLPDPPEECRRAFNDYVRLRWPIHVFALDPYNQEQNLADSLSTRRETQLALAIAFTNGQMSARNLTKYTRRLEAEYETIALNRTQIGFSHGENTFGWRFYPRYQTPDTPSNVKDFFRNQLIGGPNRNELLRERRLEPGMRECVAVVMMPSFVPYVKVDTVSNWFPLTNPKHKCLDHSQALRMSRTVQTIKTDGCGVRDACKYRPGEHERLINRADQLEARLPTQTLTSPVPILNTLGGFEMFSNGTTDLAPELFGWYGAPGIDPDNDTTTLFLVGDHFSPLRTRVIVGNQEVKNTVDMPYQKLLSRQVMQITFAKGAYAVATPEGGEVRIHVATPYGVTRELAVPVVSRKLAPPAPKPGITVGDVKLAVAFAKPPEANPAVPNTPRAVFSAVNPPPGDLKFKWTGLDPTAVPVAEYRVRFVFPIPGVNGQPATTLVFPCGDGVKATWKLDDPKDAASASNAGILVMKSEDLAPMAADLFQQQGIQDLAAAGKLDSLTTTQIIVIAVDASDATKIKILRSISANDQLTVNFKPGIWCQDCEILHSVKCPPPKPETPMTKPTPMPPIGSTPEE